MSIVAAVLIGACVFLYYNSGTFGSGITAFAVDENGVCSDIDCMSQSLISCTPARMTWTSQQNEQSAIVVIEIIGVANNLCVLKMTSGDITLKECYFPMNSLSQQFADQFFKGRDYGFGQILSDSCG